MKIGVDIMGGDFAPAATVAGSILAQKKLPTGCKIVMLGDQEVINAELKKHKVASTTFEIVHAPDVIGMGEHPTKAFSSKPNSSIFVGFRLLKEGKIDGFASNGNSGAMMVGSMYSVKTVPGVIRPSISTILPKENGGMGLILDVGINADCKPDVLYQFGILGSLYAEHVFKIKNPKVALLNLGEEPEKGNLVTQSAHNLMKDSKDFNFVGNVEGRDLFSAEKSDVVVCEGFVGNVVLKSAEAYYTTMKKRKINDEYFNRFNYEIYGATPVLGINGTVMIGHGISNEIAVKNMILATKDVVEADLSGKIREVFNT